MRLKVSAFLSRPSVLGAVHAPKAWGWEKWLASTRLEVETRVAHGGAPFAGLVSTHPEALGRWARSLFGNALPIFAKLIHTDFPSRVHMGFRQAVERDRFLGWLEREQSLMRQLFDALAVTDAHGFQAYEGVYSRWATAQALAGWRKDDDAQTAAALGGFLRSSFAIGPWLRAVRENRTAIIDVLNDIDLRSEAGNLLLASAGLVHAIFGLSHQTHPLDRSRAALESLFVTLGERNAAGASDAELAALIDRAGLPALRAANAAPPKNEAWLPTITDGAEVLAEPQQSSDTTYSLADFYTPLTWGGDRVRFRKGDAATGLSRAQLESYLVDVSFALTPLASIRRAPEAVPGASRAGAELFRLVDEPAAWPFFTAYQLELKGTFKARPPEGVFQQIVITRGRATLSDAHGAIGELGTEAAGFIPATLDGAYTLASDPAGEGATALIFAVPGARGGAPRV
jgi:hypothetical protein